MDQFSQWFWNERFWFPKGVSFNDTKSTPSVIYAQPRDLYALPVYGFIVYCLRNLFEQYISNPLAWRILNTGSTKKNLGNESKSSASVGNGFDKNLFNEKPLSNGVASSIRKSKKLKHTKAMMAKIAETSWKSLYHSFSFTFGMCILLQASWFWDTRYCWIDFPKHELWSSLYYYYMIEGAYYIALLLSLATDVKRKDRGMMMMHHVGTINLIFFSYATNQTRIGSLLMVLHRLADMLLQIAKLLLYCKRKTIANHLFIVFVIVFVITRLYIYPVYVIHTAIIKLTWYHHPYPWWYVGNAIAIGLQILHVMWAYIILKMAFKVVWKGPLDKDDRSGTDEDSGEDEDVNSKKEQ